MRCILGSLVLICNWLFTSGGVTPDAPFQMESQIEVYSDNFCHLGKIY